MPASSTSCAAGTRGGPARHALTVDDVYIRNVPTDIRSFGGGMIPDGNSIFIFEIANSSASAISATCTITSRTSTTPRSAGLDIVMVPIDGGMTLPG